MTLTYLLTYLDNKYSTQDVDDYVCVLTEEPVNCIRLLRESGRI